MHIFLTILWWLFVHWFFLIRLYISPEPDLELIFSISVAYGIDQAHPGPYDTSFGIKGREGTQRWVEGFQTPRTNFASIQCPEVDLQIEFASCLAFWRRATLGEGHVCSQVKPYPAVSNASLSASCHSSLGSSVIFLKGFSCALNPRFLHLPHCQGNYFLLHCWLISMQSLSLVEIIQIP